MLERAGLGEVAERVAALVAVQRGVRQFADATLSSTMTISAMEHRRRREGPL